MALSLLGRANIENRWRSFIQSDGAALFKALQNTEENSPEYNLAMSAVIAGLQTSVEVDYPYSSKLAFVEEKLSEQLLGR